MRSSKTELREIVEAIVSVKVLVLGDLILDRYIWGKVDRISPEAPVPIVAVTRTEDRLGCAGNVVRNLNEMNVAVVVAGIVGDDLEGEAILRLLESRNTSSDGILVAKGRPTSLKTRVIAQAQQVVRVDREDVSPYQDELQAGLAATVKGQLKNVDAVIVSDYGKGTINAKIWDTLYQARQEGVLGPSARPLVLDPHPANYSLYRGVSVAKPNRKEAEIAAGMTIATYQDAVRAGELLRERWEADRMLITLGELGLAIVPGNGADPVALDTVAREVFDVSGAGDTVTALYTAAVAAGASPELAGDLANIGAGIVVSEVGTVPIRRERLLKEIERL